MAYEAQYSPCIFAQMPGVTRCILSLIGFTLKPSTGTGNPTRTHTHSRGILRSLL